MATVSYPSWPVGVKYASLLEGWSEDQLAIAPEESEMDAGNTRQRQRYTENVGIDSVAISMTKAEFELFRTWYNTTLNKGAGRFYMNVYVGTGFVSKLCQIVAGSYKREFVETLYHVSFKRRIIDA
jgi:hypothetical protein